MRHHTKDKGDLGLAEVIADLVRNDCQVCLPISEHLPFDLVAVSPDGLTLKRVQVKFRAVSRGVIDVDMRACGLNAHGNYAKVRDLTKIDAVAVYCSDTDTVYYVEVCDFRGRSHVTLRVESAGSNQVKYVRYAHDFVGALRLFTPK